MAEILKFWMGRVVAVVAYIKGFPGKGGVILATTGSRRHAWIDRFVPVFRQLIEFLKNKRSILLPLITACVPSALLANYFAGNKSEYYLLWLIFWPVIIVTGLLVLNKAEKFLPKSEFVLVRACLEIAATLFCPVLVLAYLGLLEHARWILVLILGGFLVVLLFYRLDIAQGTKTYKIFRHPQGTVEAIKQGWSWPAFFFTWIWALFKKMWLLAIGSFVGVTVVGIIVEAIAGKTVLGLGMVYGCMFGFEGNKWRESNLRSRGYDDVGAVTASNPESAVAAFMKQEANQIMNSTAQYSRGGMK